jgi:hypothetical protein
MRSNTTQINEGLKNWSLSDESRSTPLGNPTKRMLVGNRRSVELGYLLFLQYQSRLSPGQWAYLLGLQRRVNLQELDSACGLFRRLLGSKRSQARAEKDLQKILSSTPSLSPKSIRREQRRIGVGYRDKGTLRLSHQDHQAPPRIWWYEDLAQILHLSPSWMISEDFLTEEDLARGGTNLIVLLRSAQIRARPCNLRGWDSLAKPESFRDPPKRIRD